MPYGDSMLPDQPRVRGVQFPFQVTDRVIIKVYKENFSLIKLMA